jgi:ABC-2 type transport system permease protein
MRPSWGLIREQMTVQLLVRTLNYFSLSLLVLQPFFFSAVGMLLSHAAGNAVPDLVYSVIGGGVMGMWSGIVFTSTFDIVGDRVNGTLEMIVGSPTKLASVQAIRTLTNVLSGLLALILAFLAAVAIFHLSLDKVNVWGTLISLVLLLFAMWVSGIFLANFLAWSRISGTFVEYLEMPVAILCGFMYPLRVLPAWMQTISTFIPIRWALEAMNESLLGMNDLSYLGTHWALALGLSVATLLITTFLQEKVQDKIRTTGEVNTL